MSPKSVFRAHSTFADHPKLLELGYNRAWVHPDDAAPRGVRDGDWVRLFNGRGETRIEVRVTEDARPGTVRVYSGGSPELGAANLLTPDRVTGYSESAAFNDCRVELAKAEPLYKRALAIFEKRVGPDHPNIVKALSNLAALYEKMGKREEAAGFSARARAVEKRLAGRK